MQTPFDGCLNYDCFEYNPSFCMRKPLRPLILLFFLPILFSLPSAAQQPYGAETAADTLGESKSLSALQVEYLLNRDIPSGQLPSGVFKITDLLRLPLSSSIDLQLPERKPLAPPPYSWQPGAPSLPIKLGQGVKQIHEYNQASIRAINELKLSAPSLVQREEGELLAHRMNISTVEASAPVVQAEVAPPLSGVNPSDQLHGITLGRKYWFPGLESAIQFSQTYISPNWHKGGNSALSLHSKQLLKLDFKKEKINWANELEWRLGLNTELRDSLRNYNITEDLLRLRSNLGLKAFKDWFYTFDIEARTQLFEQRSEDKSVVYSAFASPLTLTAGLGMKWVVDKKSKTHYGRRFRLDLNVAPLAYDFKWSHRKDIDMVRHGFEAGKNIYSAIGSMLRANMIIDFSDTFSWESRLYYNTSYKRIETEFENSLAFAFNRYFSTRINLLLRFDDAVHVSPEYKTRLQIYEMITVGFDLKI